MKVSSRVIVSLLLCAAAAAEDRGSISSGIEKRTGHGLSSTSKAEGRKTPGLPPGVSLDKPLTDEDAVAVALWNNSALEAEMANLGLAQADLVEAGLLRNPSVQLLLPVGAKPFEMLLGMPVEIFWQRRHRVASSRINLQQTAQSLLQRGLDLVRDVKVACAELSAAEERARIAGEAAALRARIAELTDRRLRAGDISVYDLTLANVDARTFLDTAIRLTQDAGIARERLRLLLGLRGDKSALRLKAAEETGFALPEWEDLVVEALASRPDMRAAELAVQAAGERAKWERSRIYSLGLFLSSKGSVERVVRSGPALTTDLPIFNRNQGQIARADAEVERAALLYLAQRDRVEMEVREARAQLIQAREALARVRSSLLPLVRESIQLAEKAYRDGDASWLNVLETSRQLYDVETREADALFGVKRSRAQLERAVGRRL